MINFRMFSSLRRNKCQPGIVVYACDSSGRLRHRNYWSPGVWGLLGTTVTPCLQNSLPALPCLLAFSPYSPHPQGAARLLSICVCPCGYLLSDKLLWYCFQGFQVESTLGSVRHSSGTEGPKRQGPWSRVSKLHLATFLFLVIEYLGPGKVWFIRISWG